MDDQIEANKAVVLRYWEELWNQGKMEAVSEIFVPKLHSVTKLISAWRNACPDSRVVVEAVIAEGDLVVTRYSCQGAVHTGVFEAEIGGLSMAVPPTGKVLEDHGIFICRSADGKIVELWAEWNKLELAQQLGVVPTSG
jgi:predicted ester cyclase